MKVSSQIRPCGINSNNWLLRKFAPCRSLIAEAYRPGTSKVDVVKTQSSLYSHRATHHFLA